ncbi:5-methylcytosine-specific restriction protein B [Pedobacter sp. UYP30]|uniref:McrB family protein n=1 Tax=Pedobacter sp. UYP30 TaxID=1756400 RepID=UPI0033931123
MKQHHAEDIYQFYDKFIQDFLIDGNSILSNHIAILNDATIKGCFFNYIENYNDTSGSFDAKVTDQFKNADLPTRLVFAHAEWLWSFAVDDIRIPTKKGYVKRITNLDDEELLDTIYPVGFGSAGQWHTNNKYDEIKFILILIRFIRQKVVLGEITTVQEVKDWIEYICLFQKYGTENTAYMLPDAFKNELQEKSLAVTNILTYAGNPNNYERIASENHKNQILISFWGLLTEGQKVDENLNTDDKILLIRKELGTLTYPNFDFYEFDYARIWNYSLTEEGFSEVQGLQYKKAIILYGPPGTSKTFTAKHLADALITYAYLKNKANVTTFFREKPDVTKDRIHHLQLHPNYTYEDFIAGYQLKDGNTKKTPGTLFKICEKAKDDLGATPNHDMPHVLILDEINRIDLSRLFGEVFSALENRDQPIQVGIGDLELTIPRNLYVIGTMNEIDFSLERIDFALRRRFLWFFYGYDENTLRNIIHHKNRTLGAKLRMDEEVNRFIRNATQLNRKISSIPELGKQYQIGHTFFAEIVEIYKSYKEIGGYKSLRYQLYRGDGATNILWKISLEPILVSFLGNMELEVQNEILKELKIIYNQ